MKPVNRLIARQTCDQLVPKTATDHLLAEAERVNAVHDREAIEALGREMSRRGTREFLYLASYYTACRQIAAGVSREDIRAEMRLVPGSDGVHFETIFREAYEDALAGRPPRREGNPSSSAPSS